MASDSGAYVSVRGAAFIGIGSMVGAGIFALLGQAAVIAGSAVWLSFLLAGLVTALLAYTPGIPGARGPPAPPGPGGASLVVNQCPAFDVPADGERDTFASISFTAASNTFYQVRRGLTSPGFALPRLVVTRTGPTPPRACSHASARHQV